MDHLLIFICHMTAAGSDEAKFSCSEEGEEHVCYYLRAHAVYLKPNINARSRNHCFRGKTLNITYSESACVCCHIHPAFNAHGS